MSFSWLSPAAFAAGLAILAGLLFALQRLRVRHRDVTVVTTLFWRQAVEETRARVLVQRFRHPLAYLLVLAIAALAWLAVAGPRVDASGGRARVLVLDGSAAMAEGDRFARALEALRARVGELPRGTTRVLLAAGHVRTLLAPGEEAPLLDARARGLAPEACPASVARALASLAAEPFAEGADLEVFGSAPLGEGTSQESNSQRNITVRRAFDAGAPGRNGGIVGLGAAEAASGAWDRVDVFAEAAGDGAGDLVLLLDGEPLAGARSEAAPQGRVRLAVADLPARGGRLEAKIPAGDGNPLDDTATLSLPNRRPIRVALSPAVPASVRAALAADPGVELAAGEWDVAVRAEGDPFGGESPALELCAGADGHPAFLVRHPEPGDAGEALRAAFRSLGLDEVDSQDLAEKVGKEIALSFEPSPRRAVVFWGELLGEAYDFTKSRSFPLFLGRSVRWLAGAAALEPWLAAGERRIGRADGWTDAAGRRLDPVGAEGRVPRAGALTDPRGLALAASLLDPATSAAASARAPEGAAPAAAAAGFDPLPWIVLLALALLAIEWWLVRTERIP